ncbi:hypothetical protein Tco_0656318 [Tanacetum coccineum]|uniref:Uncharacterized protein n=1 Tax=Tanacetum coccineum TaxID=301880 RepID=A0ABQ4X8G1_9ASTR
MILRVASKRQVTTHMRDSMSVVSIKAFSDYWVTLKRPEFVLLSLSQAASDPGMNTRMSWTQKNLECFVSGRVRDDLTTCFFRDQNDIVIPFKGQ